MLEQIAQQGAFSADIAALINNNFASVVGPGTRYYVEPARGADNNDGTLQKPLKTLRAGYDKAIAGRGDTVVLVSDGATTGTARLGAGFTWAKNNTHLVGIDSGVNLSNRARIAPTAGVTAFATLFTVSASGCRFQNIQWFHGFTAGTTAQICLSITGGRNLFIDCHIAGMGDTDAASAQDAGSRSVKIATTGENMFVRCTIGLDTVTRTVANASVEFAGGAPRNKFIDCDFPFITSAGTPLGVIVSAAAGSDRFQLFDRCRFINAIKSTSTQMDALSTLAASIGGMHIYKDCTLIGITEYGSDATSRAQIYVDGGAPTAATSGIAVNPT